MQIELKENFKWFLSEEFKALRGGFKPTDDDNNNNDDKKSDVKGENFFPEVSVSDNDNDNKEVDLEKEKTPLVI
jgi:hypothetical protein